jgi:hypothetical protein
MLVRCERSELPMPLNASIAAQVVTFSLQSETIVAKIKTASCSFDTSPTALKELKDAGVPDSVILAMVQGQKN